MKFFLDTEFIEGFHKPVFGKRRHHIDLISIGIVSESGHEYYAISNEFNPRDANEWVMENVLKAIVDEFITNSYDDYSDDEMEELLTVVVESSRIWEQVQLIQGKIGKSNQQIVDEIKSFVALHSGESSPEFYGYFCDYDWVLFCSLFGTMMDLPKNYPMYCRDLKQSLDNYVRKNCKINSSLSEEEFMRMIKQNGILLTATTTIRYPIETNEHNALADAKWTQQLYNFLKQL